MHSWWQRQKIATALERVASVESGHHIGICLSVTHNVPAYVSGWILPVMLCALWDQNP